GLTWWPAEVVCVSGHLILFRWCVPETYCSSADLSKLVDVRINSSPSAPMKAVSNGFWLDVKGSDWNLIRPIGCSLVKNQQWIAPTHLSHILLEKDFNSSSEWAVSLKKRSIPGTFFDQHALYLYETIRIGGYFECEHEFNPGFVWPAKVLTNVGGRVRLSWFGSDPKKQTGRMRLESSTFTIFFLHRRIHPLGWGKHYGLTYSPPPGLIPDRSISNVDAFARGAPSAFVHLSNDVDFRKMRVGHPLLHHDPPQHEFKVGWKLEAVNPQIPYVIQPATISQVFNSRYFLVQLDNLTHSTSAECVAQTAPQVDTGTCCFVSHAGASEIMPVNTSQLRGFHLAPPPGWSSKRPFTWTNYLTFLSSTQQLRCMNSENGLLRAASTNSLFTVHHNQAWAGGPGRPGFVHNPPPNDLLVDRFSSASSTHVLYCPSEAAFRGVQIGDMFPSPAEGDTQTVNQLSKYVSNSTHSKDGASEKYTTDSNSFVKDRTSSRFLLGMKLEMVIPKCFVDIDSTSSDPEPKLCTATVTRVDEPYLLWVLPDMHFPNEPGRLHAIMIDARSTDLYPVGWAAFVGHPIVAPAGYENCIVDTVTGLTDGQVAKLEDTPVALWDIGLRPTHDLQYQTITYESEELCPPVYINTKCYLGPFLCRTNLDLLPQRFGPGPTTRVMHSLLTRLVSAAYKPIRVLRMFEADWASGMASALSNLRTAQRMAATNRENTCVTRGRFNLQTAKANFNQAELEILEQHRTCMRAVLLRIRCPRRGVKIEAPVEVCCRARAVEEFCRQISLVLEACPHLVSLIPPTSNRNIELTTTGQSAAASNQEHGSGFSGWSFNSVVNTAECPSFCASRLRSRNLDRMPGWKRRMYASLRPFGIQPPTSNSAGHHSTRVPSAAGLRTRSAAAAAQRQQHSLGRALSPLHGLSVHTNGLPTGRTVRRHRGRVAGRFRGSNLRRASGQIGFESDVHSYLSGHLKRPSKTNNCDKVGTADPDLFPVITGHDQQAASTQVVSQSNNKGLDNHTSKHCVHAFTHTNCSWRSNRIPFVTPGIYASQRFRSISRPFAMQDRYLQDNRLSSIISDAPRVTLTSNPLFWSSFDLASYLGETDCREMWPWLAAEAVDGQAFMLLTLPVLHHLVGLRWDDAIRLARHVVSVKRAFVEQFGADAGDYGTSVSTTN
ncbi:hypothetical protein EG68_11687, partial [Paragonimus skrjabini miyazakii]